MRCMELNSAAWDNQDTASLCTLKLYKSVQALRPRTAVRAPCVGSSLYSYCSR